MGFGEWVIVFLIVLVVFGAGKLPQLGDALGKSIKNFRKAAGADGNEGRQEIEVSAASKELPGPHTSAHANRMPPIEANIRSDRPSSRRGI